MAQCATCGKQGAASRCSQCQAAHYCNRACQSKGWRDHKNDCHKTETRPSRDPKPSPSPFSFSLASSSSRPQPEPLVQAPSPPAAGLQPRPVNRGQMAKNLNPGQNPRSEAEGRSRAGAGADAAAPGVTHLSGVEVRAGGARRAPPAPEAFPKSLRGFAYEAVPPAAKLLLSRLVCFFETYAQLARQMALLQTATLALSGPLAIPETDGGRAWFKSHDENWDLILPAPSERLVAVCGSLLPERILRGEFDGAAGAPLSSSTPSSCSKAGTPILMSNGARDSVVPRAFAERSIGYLKNTHPKANIKLNFVDKVIELPSELPSFIRIMRKP
eukprot:jgi/Mesen1/9929/ME000070S09215